MHTWIFFGCTAIDSEDNIFTSDDFMLAKTRTSGDAEALDFILHSVNLL